jgi:integrase/recombinase XerD
MEMDRLIEGFLKDSQSRGMAEMTILHYKYCLKGYMAYMAGRSLLEANKETLRGFIDYLREQGRAQKSIENVFSALSTFYGYLVFEELIPSNPIPAIRERYLRRYKDNGPANQRKLISIEEMARLINSTLDIRDKAVITLLAKTGIRRNELVTLDLSDVDFIEMKIRLKPTAKRSNRTVFFDDETAFILRRWAKIRVGMNRKDSPAFFLNVEGDRLARSGVYNLVVNAAEHVGLHDPSSSRMEDHFSPHCMRHWFTTHLRRAGMPREFIQELRGDARREAIDIYDHIDHKELREAYLAHIPQLGI